MRFVIVNIFLLLYIATAAQKTDCKKEVVKAENVFKQGQYSQAEQIVQSSLENCRLPRKSKQEAYELLARINIETDNLDEAYKNLKKVIKLNPSYQPNPARVEEDYIKYYNKYKVIPVLSAGVYFEPIFPSYKTVGEPNEIHADFDYSGAYSSEKFNNSFGITTMVGLPTNTRFNLSLGLMTLNYTRKIEHKTISGFNTTLHEKDSYMNIPLEVAQHFKHKRWTGYVGLGYTYSILQSANAEITAVYPVLVYDTAYNYVDLKQKGTTLFTDFNSIDAKPIRSNLEFMKYSAGFTYNIADFIVDLKFSYNTGLRLNNSEEYYLPGYSIFRNYYLDNSFYLNYFNMNLSVSYIIAYKILKSKK